MKTAIVFLLTIIGLAVEIKADLALCSVDDDCTYLGGLKCIKSFCSTGVCSCPRNTVSKWIGSDRMFQCVPLRRVGEPCSTDGETGICGAPNSECDQTTLLCKCTTGNIPIWSGERCVSSYQTTQGETCGTGIDGSTCSLAATTGSTNNCLGPSATGATTTRTAPMQLAITTCGCKRNEKLVISNEYYQTFSASPSKANFVHLKEPICVTRQWGDACQIDTDCPSGNGMSCTNNVCACTTAGHTYSYDKSSCASPLGQGVACNGVSGTCDGSLGLFCGDICAITGTNVVTAGTATCECGPYHTGTTTCTLITTGSSCVGDQQCKYSEESNICEITDRGTGSSAITGSCVAGASSIVAGFVTLLLPLMVMLQMRN